MDNLVNIELRNGNLTHGIILKLTWIFKTRGVNTEQNNSGWWRFNDPQKMKKMASLLRFVIGRHEQKFPQYEDFHVEDSIIYRKYVA